MAQNLTNSPRDRQKILNNPVLLHKIEQHLNLDEFLIDRLIYEDNLVFTKWQLECLFDVSTYSIKRCIEAHQQELQASGYLILKRDKLEEFFVSCNSSIKNTAIKYNLDVLKIRGLELFSFRAFLNMAMLLSESDEASFIRSRMLDILIDITLERENGRVRYLNRHIQRLFNLVYTKHYSCSGAFKDAVDRYVESSLSAYQDATGKDIQLSTACHYDKIYELIFDNKHKQYRQYLGRYTSSYECNRDKYKSEAKFRSYHSIKNRYRIVLCYEICQAITNIEDLLAKEIQVTSERINRKIKFQELDKIVFDIKSNSQFKLFIEEARIKMATVDFLNSSEKSLKSILHDKMNAHYKTVSEKDLNDFIAVKTQSLKEKLSASKTMAVFQRLKER